MYIQREEQAQFVCIIRVNATIEQLPPCSTYTQRNFQLLNPCELLKRWFWYFNMVYSKELSLDVQTCHTNKKQRANNKEQSSKRCRFQTLPSKGSQRSNYPGILHYFQWLEVNKRLYIFVLRQLTFTCSNKYIQKMTQQWKAQQT